MNLRTRILSAALSLLTALGIGLATATPAAAEDYANAVCNSEYSVGPIRVYSNYPGATYSYKLYDGQCVSRPWNGADNLRVDVEYPDSCGICLNDVDSYKKGEIGVGWGPCYDGENEAADPPDSYNDGGIRIRTYSRTIADGGCS